MTSFSNHTGQEDPSITKVQIKANRPVRCVLNCELAYACSGFLSNPNQTRQLD
jgi:hypothetical protein